MVKQHYKNNSAFSLVEMLAVLLIVSIIVIILSRISINSYEKYQERLAVNELVSEIYNVQTRSLNEHSFAFIWMMKNLILFMMIMSIGKK